MGTSRRRGGAAWERSTHREVQGRHELFTSQLDVRPCLNELAASLPLARPRAVVERAVAGLRRGMSRERQSISDAVWRARWRRSSRMGLPCS